MEWTLRAACRPEFGHDPDLFFPVAAEGTPLGDAQVAAAVAVCRTCPVRRQCLAHALDVGEEFGIWGGLTESDRRALRRPQYVSAA